MTLEQVIIRYNQTDRHQLSKRSGVFTRVTQVSLCSDMHISCGCPLDQTFVQTVGFHASGTPLSFSCPEVLLSSFIYHSAFLVSFLSLDF